MKILELFGILFAIHWVRYAVVAGGALYAVAYAKVDSDFVRDRRIQKKKFVISDLKREYVSSLKTMVVFSIVLLPLLHPALRDSTAVYRDASIYGGGWWIVASLIMLVVFNDTYFYWLHRALHHPNLFRSIHRTHHLSRNPSPLASHSFHPFEAVLEIIWIVPIYMLIPIYQPVYIAFGLVSLLVNVNGHLGVELMTPAMRAHPVLKWMNTATHHNQHHEKVHGNYGFYFLFWDRLMGTERASADLALSEQH